MTITTISTGVTATKMPQLPCTVITAIPTMRILATTTIVISTTVWFLWIFHSRNTQATEHLLVIHQLRLDQDYPVNQISCYIRESRLLYNTPLLKFSRVIKTPLALVFSTYRWTTRSGVSFFTLKYRSNDKSWSSEGGHILHSLSQSWTDTPTATKMFLFYMKKLKSQWCTE